MTTKYGDFVPPVFHTIGDPYKETGLKSGRDKGLSFIATVGRRGKVQHANASSTDVQSLNVWLSPPLVYKAVTTFDFENMALISMTILIQNNDACFDKAKILFEGEKFVDPSRCVQF